MLLTYKKKYLILKRKKKGDYDEMEHIILASQSPRRRELLSKIYDSFEVITSDADESLPDGVHPSRGVEILAVRKGAAVAEAHNDAIVISSDTLVELGGEPLGKPVSADDAHRMLTMLSGNYHNVHTGVAVHYRGRVRSGVASSCVKFKTITDDEIYAYIAGGEPMDKAGAYAIQGEGGKFIEGYDGDFDTIMGLSVSLTEKLIREITSDND